MPATLQQAVESLIKSGATLPPSSRAALTRSMENYIGSVSRNILDDAMEKLFSGLRSIAQPQKEMREGKPVTTGETPESVRANVIAVLNRFDDPGALADTLNLDFKIGVATEVTQGAGRFVADQTNLEEYPAWELLRVYDRDVPRGFRRVGGVIVPVPDDDWPSRWRAAASASGDEDAARVLESTGRMIALKSSGIWQALGDGAGGYDDTLGNPFAPFAFNSGFDTEGVSIKECVELGLLDEGEAPEPTPFDWSQLISLPEAA